MASGSLIPAGSLGSAEQPLIACWEASAPARDTSSWLWLLWPHALQFLRLQETLPFVIVDPSSASLYGYQVLAQRLCNMSCAETQPQLVLLS
jgi:hypothetical protein